MGTEDKESFSHHVFILPFSFNKYPKKNKENWEKVENVWELPYIKENKYRDIENNEKNIEYAFKHFFNHEFYKTFKKVDNYKYTGGEKVYQISYWKSEEELDYFNLKIQSITLRIVEDINVGFLIFDLYNDEYDSIEEVKAINQYGRRLYNPFLSNEKVASEAPNNICILDEDKNSEKNSDMMMEAYTIMDGGKRVLKSLLGIDEEDILPVFFEKEDTNPKEKSDMMETYTIVDAPKQLLKSFFGSEDISIFPDPSQVSDENNKNVIRDITGNRMFTLCYSKVKDDIKDMIDFDTNIPLANSNDEYDKLKNLYSIAYIDKKDSTWQSRYDIQEIIKRISYVRWIDYNSLYLVTSHSLVYLAGGNGETPSFLKGYFTSEYLEMVLLTLLQRIALLQFSKRAGESIGKSEENSILTKEYAEFQNNYFLPEITPEEQGIELYGMLRRELYIDELSDNLTNQITILHQINQDGYSNRLNIIVLCIGVLTLILTARQVTNSFLCAIFLVISLVILLVILLVIFKVSKTYIKKLL